MGFTISPGSFPTCFSQHLVYLHQRQVLLTFPLSLIWQQIRLSSTPLQRPSSPASPPPRNPPVHHSRAVPAGQQLAPSRLLAQPTSLGPAIAKATSHRYDTSGRLLIPSRRAAPERERPGHGTERGRDGGQTHGGAGKHKALQTPTQKAPGAWEKPVLWGVESVSPSLSVSRCLTATPSEQSVFLIKSQYPSPGPRSRHLQARGSQMRRQQPRSVSPTKTPFRVTLRHSHGRPSARCRSGAVPGAVTGSEASSQPAAGQGSCRHGQSRHVRTHLLLSPPPPRSLNRLFDAKASGTEKAVTAAAQLASSRGCARLPASLRARWMRAASKSPPRAKSPRMRCWMSRAMGPPMPSPGCSESCSTRSQHSEGGGEMPWSRGTCRPTAWPARLSRGPFHVDPPFPRHRGGDW